MKYLHLQLPILVFVYINPEKVPAIHTTKEDFISFVLFNDAMFARFH